MSEKIGIYDIEGINKNPLTNKDYENLYKDETIEIEGEKLPRTYKNLAKKWSSFKVYNFRDEIVKSISHNNLTFVKAGTGVGKTVLLPKFALHAVNYKEKVITTIPKRIITRTNAEFAAQTLDVKLGEEVGYYFQGESKQSSKTKLLYSTTGSLISKLTGSDAELKEYKVIIIDEAHERNIQTDILLMLLKKILETRKDLRVVITSATIDLNFFINYFKDIKDIKYNSIDVGSATLYPIKDIYLDKSTSDWQDAIIKVLMYILLSSTNGDILVFARSMADGIKICEKLAKQIDKYNKNVKSKLKDTKTIKLYGGNNLSLTGGKVNSKVKNIKITESTKSVIDYLNPFCTYLASGVSKDMEELAISEHEYLKVFNGKYYRKIVVSTNVAESSLTVEGIKYVIDTGLEYSDVYYPEYKSESLLESKISKASVKQRRGRAGRTAPGICYHLYTEKEYKALSDYPIPDINKTDLTDQILNLFRMPNINTLSDIKALFDKLISPPEDKFINDAIQNLYLLGCLTNKTDMGKLTGMGFEISKFRSISSMMARMIIASYKLKCSDEIIRIAAMLLIADGQLSNIFYEFMPNSRLSTSENKKEHQRYLNLRKQYKNDNSDILALLKIYDNWDKNGKSRAWSINNYINHSLMKKTNRFIKTLNNVNINLKKSSSMYMENLDSTAVPNFSKLNNSLVFENKYYSDLIKLSLNDKILVCYYIGYIPYICFKLTGNYYLSCNSSENKNISLNQKSFVNKNNITDIIIPNQIFWSNIDAPLKINIITSIKPSLRKILEKIMGDLEILCIKQKKKLKESKFVPKYNRL